MRVLIGMSGGVDSSVAALLLKEQGYDVVGATMALWGNSEFFETLKNKLDNQERKIATHCACLSPDKQKDLQQAKAIADKLGIEHHIIDCSKEYEDYVINYFKKEYMSGRTPNPCVQCNRFVKFGAFWQLAQKSGIRFDKFATGHYAVIEKINDKFVLKKGINPKKDQSYFLYGLNQEQLSKTILPLGKYEKEEIRQIAKENGFETADKPDSQDFYNGDYNDILNEKPLIGNIVDINGKKLGEHNGFWNYTIGQRKGLGVAAAEPLYVVKLKKETNEVVVAYKDKALNEGFIASNVVLNCDLSQELQCQVKIRSSQQPKDAVIKQITDNKVEVHFAQVQQPVAIGQSAVFYLDDTVLGGGIIDDTF